MSFKTKRPQTKRSRTHANPTEATLSSASTSSALAPTRPLPTRLLTSHDIRRGHNYRVVPTVTPRGIAGTYTFPVPSTFTPVAPHASAPPSPTEEYPAQLDQRGDSPPVTGNAKSARQVTAWTTDVIPRLVPDNLRRRFSNAYRWYTALLDSAQTHVQGVIEEFRESILSASRPDPSTVLPPSSPPASPPSSPGFPRTCLSEPPSPDSSRPESPSTSPTPTSDHLSSASFPELSLLLDSEQTSPTDRSSSSTPPPHINSETAPRRTRPSEHLRRCCGMCFGGTHKYTHDPKALVDIIVSIDACFTQKRNKNTRNPHYRDAARTHSNTVFLSDADVKSMETYVNDIRARPPSPIPSATPRGGDGEDYVEAGMQVPASVLDECGSSFVAADEKREKASTQFFADTGVMSLLCRHDRVLFAVNMTHKGERQHYALALIKRFMGEIPDDMTLGLLYDIACQLKRNLHIKYLTANAHKASGEWLARRWAVCEKRKAIALKGIRDSGKDTAFLRAQWAAQVTAQTKPMPRRSKHKGQQAVMAVLSLDTDIASEQHIIAKLDKLLALGRGDFLETSEQLTETNRRLQRLHDLRRAKIGSLGIAETNQLSRLRDNAFLRARMNALAIKHRLRDRLRQRKFELEKLERALDRRAPTIQKLAKSYNDLCATMRELVRKRQAPRGAICPDPIPDGGLWKLNVDDSIWQDLGLEDDGASDNAPPPWLKDESTRLKIRHVLDYDRVLEEERRVVYERLALQQFAKEEWLVIQTVKKETDNIDLIYQMEHRARLLCRLCYIWRSSTTAMPGDNDAWGPSIHQMDQAGTHEVAAHVTSEQAPIDTADLDDVGSDNESWQTDGDLAEQVELIAFHDEYTEKDLFVDPGIISITDTLHPPSKRRRTETL
ncbi:hypothetical protein HWV62_33227 [Athelia sp. TMB]|nr:hypothetical protein HWV62_33227 [Athelia sp. TMB]